MVYYAMIAIVLSNAFLEKFSGDSVNEIKTNYQNYLKRVSER